MIAHLILAALALLASQVLLVLASPTRRCFRCKGARVTRSRITKRLMGCPRCKGTGRTYRRGAVLLHRLRWSITAELREMAAERRTRREESTQ
jgi:hypothetical protein